MWLQRAVLATVFVIASGTAIPAQDFWRRVAAGGLPDLQNAGESRQGIADAAAIHGDHIYIATHFGDPAGVQHARVLRATLLADEFWSDITPGWAAREIVQMLGVTGGLLVATVDDGLWLRRRSDWIQILAHVSRAPIHAIAAVDAPDGRLICVARGALQIRCNTSPADTGWRTFAVPATLSGDSSIASGELHGFGGRLHLGVGGAGAGSRDCAVWSSAVVEVAAPARWGSSWSALTTDCFGTHNTWVTSMAAFAGALYIGIGGHESGVGVYRTADTGFEDVTPPHAPGAAIPRYGAMATPGTFPDARLFVGNHVTGFGTDVFSLSRRGSWRFSNAPGFGDTDNLSTSALAASDYPYVYAGTINLLDGFEVWRRVPALFEMLDSMDRDSRLMRTEIARLRVCVPFPVPCPFELERVIVQFERIHLAFDKADHPADDALVIANARALMQEAASELEKAGPLVKQISFAQSPKQAHQLGQELMMHLDSALNTTEFAIELARASVRSKPLK